MRLFFFFRKLLLHKKGAQWLRLEMSPAVNSAKFLHKQMENVCSHKEVTRDPPPLFIQKNCLLCRKFSVMQKFSAMQKVFCYAEKFSGYAEKLHRKFSVIQKNYAESFLVCRKIFFDYAKKKINSCAKKKKLSFKHESFFLQRQCP